MIGRTLAQYRIVEEISRGGMGVVYRATDTRLGRDVALKVLPEDLLHDAERRERLLHEARAASALEHPHIAVIHAVDDVDGVTFIAMELIRGEKLSETLARGPLSQARAVDLAIEIAEGLSRAHDISLVHRDLKPANVMVTDDGHAKIIDFGLAKLHEQLPSNASTATVRGGTNDGAIVGTAAYMSPEQARGLRTDHRSDVFSFGLLLYETLTGRPAYGGASGLDTMNAILTQPVPPLPATTGPVEVSQELQRVIGKCTAKEPDERYQGMKDIVVDLRAARRRLESASGATTVSGTWPPAATRAPASRRHVSIAIAAAVVVLGAGLWWWTQRDGAGPAPTSGRRSVAVLYFDNNTGDASLDWLRTGLANMLVTDLSQSTEFEVLGTDRVQQIMQDLKRGDDAVISADVVKAIADRAAVDTVLLGSYVKSGDVIRIEARLQNARTGRVVTSERVEGSGESSLFRLIDELTRRFKARLTAVAGPQPLITAPGAQPAETGLDRGLTEITTSSIEAYRQYAEGIHAHERGMSALAAPLLEKAIATDPQFGMAYVKLAVVNHNLANFVRRDEYAKRALDLAQRLTARERYYIEGFYYSLRAETIGRGIEAYEQGLALHPEHQASRHNLALGLMFLERLPEAIRHSEELIRRRVSNPTTYENLNELYVMTDQAPRARALAEEYLQRFPESAPGLRALASVRLVEGRLDEANDLYRRSEALNPQNMLLRLGRRSVALVAGRWADAEAVVKQMQAGAPFERLAGLMSAAAISSARGRSGDAAALLERAAMVPDVAPFGRAAMRNRLSLLLLRQDRAASALPHLRIAAENSRGLDQEFETLQLLAVAHAALGQQKESAAALSTLETRAKALPSDREIRRIHWARGEIARLAGDTAGAAAELSKAAAMLPPHGQILAPPPSHASLWYAAAAASVRVGRDADAIPLLEKVQSGYERVHDMDAWARSFYLLGQIHERRGDATRAREQYARFLDLWRDGDLERGWVADAQKRLTSLGAR